MVTAEGANMDPVEVPNPVSSVYFCPIPGFGDRQNLTMGGPGLKMWWGLNASGSLACFLRFSCPCSSLWSSGFGHVLTGAGGSLPGKALRCFCRTGVPQWLSNS